MYIHDILTQMEEKINILYAEDNTTAAMIYTEILEEARLSCNAGTGTAAERADCALPERQGISA